MTRDELWVCHLGTVPYLDAVVLQERVRARRQAGELPDTLLLLEHPPVYTRGRRSDPGELVLGEDFYRERGIDVVGTNRGGRFEQLADAGEEARRVGAVEDAVVAGEGDGHRVARDDLAVVDHGPRLK